MKQPVLLTLSRSGSYRKGADPQDIRYNMIHWTHRRTRGYSYGYGVTDPRTGEIIKGNVNLGSLRLRQDYLHGQGLIPGFEYLEAVADNNSASVNMALDRVRQLSAHEVGHTLGYPHNYLGNTFDRETVMDYPCPAGGNYRRWQDRFIQCLCPAYW